MQEKSEHKPKIVMPEAPKPPVKHEKSPEIAPPMILGSVDTAKEDAEAAVKAYEEAETVK